MSSKAVCADTLRAMNDSEPVVVVSVDLHPGPRLVEDLRPYCPSKHLDEFDGLVGQVPAMNVATM
jgi:hypothetical protein